ncbi:MAG: DUF6624 domain-containing protein [Chitinophagales bacterium]
MKYTLRILLVCISFLCIHSLYAQDFKTLIAEAEEAYQAKNHKIAGEIYLKAFALKEFQNIDKGDLYNAACVFALQNGKEQAFDLLQKAIEAGWRDIAWMQKDGDLKVLRGETQWGELLQKAQKKIAEFEASLKYPRLRVELLQMKEEDQRHRRLMVQLQADRKKNAAKIEKLISTLTDLDTKHTARMEEVVLKIGWPKISDVGEDGSNAAWVLVQHADKRPDFQNKCLDLLKEAINAQEAKSSNYAYLYDRVQVAYSDKQVYATQTQRNSLTNQLEFIPIKNEHEVNQKRQEMGLSDILGYAKRIGIDYKILSEAEAQAKANTQENEYIQLTAKGEISYEDGEYENAQRFYRRMMQLNGNIETDDIYRAACAASLSAKEKQSTFYFLNKAILKGWNDLPKLQSEKAFENLHGSPEWLQLVGILKAAKKTEK